MTIRWLIAGLLLFLAVSLLTSPISLCQDQQPDSAGSPSRAATTSQDQARNGGENFTRPVFGKISALQNDSVEVTSPDGNKLVLKLTAKTEYRKDRQPAKLSDFKVGDPVIVRTDQGNSGTALMVASSQGFVARGGASGSGGPMGIL